MDAPRVQIAYAGEAFREGWQILRKRSALWLVILAACLPGILVPRVYRLPTPGEPDPGSFTWLAKNAMLGLVTGFVGLIITATMAAWVRGCVRGTLLSAKQVFVETGRLWRPFLAFQVCAVAAGAGLGGWFNWFLAHTYSSKLSLTTDMLIAFWIPYGVSQAGRLVFWALVPGVILAREINGGLRLSFSFVRRFPVLLVVLLAVNAAWDWGVWPPIRALITSKTFHWGQGWFDNPLATTPALGWAVSHFVGSAAQGCLAVAGFVAVWRRWE